MSEIIIFTHEAFGDVRTLRIDGKPYFAGKDVAVALGYKNSRDAIGTHCKGVVKRDSPTSSGIQEISFIPESDVYRLVMRSKLPAAETFQDWVCEEVLPTLRATGSYTAPGARPPLPSVPDLVAEKIAAFQVIDSAGAEVLRMLVDLHRDITAPEPARATTAPDLSLDPKTMAVAHWLGQLAMIQVECGLAERQYTMPELLAQRPPIPEKLANRSVALGQRLAVLTGTPIPMEAGRKAVIVSTRNRNGSRWLLQVSQAM